MSHRFLSTLFSPSVLQQQQAYYGRAQRMPSTEEVDSIGRGEEEFIAARDSFYMATVTPDGWPYLQHRGGPAGFLKVLDSHTLAFADFSGNRQLISTGNLVANDRVALFLMDYPHQERLKILGRVQIIPAREQSALVAQVAPAGIAPAKVERIYRISVTGLNWNCPQYITPRFTAAEIQEAAAPLHRRVTELEAEVAALRSPSVSKGAN